MNGDAIIGIYDVHGYLGEDEVENGAFQALESIQGETIDGIEIEELVSREKENGEYNYSLAADNTDLVFGGDMIDRGPESEEAMDMIYDLLEDSRARDNEVQYLMGNHELAMAMPDTVGLAGGGSFWSEADQHTRENGNDYREELLKRMKEGDIMPIAAGLEVDYVHAGTNDYVDNWGLQRRLMEIGDILFDAYQEGEEEFRSVQQDIVNNPRYSELVSAGRDSGGIFWLDWEHIEEDGPAKVVGHTRHSLADKDTVPVKGESVNVNTMRDYQGGKREDIILSLETDEGLYLVHTNPNSGEKSVEKALDYSAEPETDLGDLFGDSGQEAEEEDETTGMEPDQPQLPGETANVEDREEEPQTATILDPEESGEDHKYGFSLSMPDWSWPDTERFRPDFEPGNLKPDLNPGRFKPEIDPGYLKPDIDFRPSEYWSSIRSPPSESSEENHQEPAGNEPMTESIQEPPIVEPQENGPEEDTFEETGIQEEIDFYDNDGSSPVKPWERE